ncbi:hypothetical protein, partial [Paenibacillus antibioticophila]|uniref:hypothetical protein n=1 Tax=Paenibacillus antibioticophila TaxID=1274374 RepID=UPI001BB352F6
RSCKQFSARMLRDEQNTSPRWTDLSMQYAHPGKELHSQKSIVVILIEEKTLYELDGKSL